MSDKFKWGIIGTGNIAKQFARGLKSVPDAELIAVGSRSQQSADKFGDEFDVPHRHSSYEALASDPDVQAVYIGTPHTSHKANTVLCLNAGKAVICEKPFAVNLSEAEEMVSLAKEKKLFLMEAMWTRFLPIFVKIRQLLDEGVIGEARMVQADFGFRMGYNPEHRLLNPELAGGALLDVGIYPVSLASWVFGGPPDTILSMANIGQTGVDEQNVILFGYEGGKQAMLSSAVRLTTPVRAVIMGTEGRIEVNQQFFFTDRFTLHRNGEQPREYIIPNIGNGYNYEATELMNCVRAGKLESETMPLSESLELMKTMDAIRAQWGLKYPME